MTCFLILGDQLFPISKELLSKKSQRIFYLAEDWELCTRFKIHQHKLVLFLAAMRHYRLDLEEKGFQVHYHELSEHPYEERLIAFLKKHKIREIESYAIHDRFLEERLQKAFQDHDISWTQLDSPGFLTPRKDLQNYLGGVKRPFMKTFYEWQRRRLNVLLDPEGEPLGGRWSFDDENRERLPEKIELPETPLRKSKDHSRVTQEVIRLVKKNFADHPGDASEFWLPVQRSEALQWATLLTPFLNTGLLTPQEVLNLVLQAAHKKSLPLNSIEGFVRQLIGWREFIFGIDRNFGEKQFELNHFQHARKLTSHWYEGTTGLPPLDETIKKANRWGYTHHIERLMILGNSMLLCEIHPHEAYRWFMELFIDSADWVMGPNVFGMGIFSDGGIFATKPYACGSNYLLKMSRFEKGPWCDIADGLYWSFIGKNQKQFLKNPRMATMARSYDRLSSERKEKLLKVAEDFKSRVTS
jgi:deoxyribodipyrimidine photolyase-related protein